MSTPSWGEAYDMKVELSSKVEFYNEDHIESGPDGGQFTGPGDSGSGGGTASEKLSPVENRRARKATALISNIKELKGNPNSPENDNAIARNQRDLRDVAPYIKDPKVAQNAKDEIASWK